MRYAPQSANNRSRVLTNAVQEVARRFDLGSTDLKDCQTASKTFH